MPIAASPSIPTESSTAAPAGGFSTWFKNIGEWIKSLSPSGASQYDTDWVAITLAANYEAQGTPAPAVRRIGKTVHMRGLVRNIQTPSVFPAGAIVVGTIPAGFTPASFLYRRSDAASTNTDVRVLIKSGTGEIEVNANNTSSSWVSLGIPSWTVD